MTFTESEGSSKRQKSEDQLEMGDSKGQWRVHVCVCVCVCVCVFEGGYLSVCMCWESDR